MNEERRKSDRRVPPAVVEFAVEERQQLLEKIADQAREIERLKAGQESLILVRDDYKRQAGEYRTLWSKAVVKPRPHGLVLPERDDVIRKAVGMCNRIPGSTTWNAAEYAYDEFVARLNSSPVSADEPFQSRVLPWLLECFGETIASDVVERNHRFLEEALELVQACGCPADEAHKLVDYVYGRPVGEKSQEVGGVMVTLAALCLAQGLDMHLAGETELDRITQPAMVERIREKQKRKPAMSPLPGVYPERALTTAAPNHSEQVREGWQLVPVEPTPEMLAAGDKYIGTPATYKAMLSACPSPAITKDFSQFLSAVMDAAGLIRHGRQSKELSEYLGMKCMEYRGVAPSPGSQEQG